MSQHFWHTIFGFGFFFGWKMVECGNLVLKRKKEKSSSSDAMQIWMSFLSDLFRIRLDTNNGWEPSWKFMNHCLISQKSHLHLQLFVFFGLLYDFIGAIRLIKTFWHFQNDK